MAVRIDGKAVSASIKKDLAARVEALKAQGIEPGLGTILVGSDTVNEYGMNTFTTEDTGTKLNAAIVARNRLIEERLKVTIKSETIDCYEARDLADRI